MYVYHSILLSHTPSHACTLTVVNLSVMVVCGAPYRQQLWRKLLDMMAGEAMQLRHLLSLPEKDTWVDEQKDEPLISDSGEILHLNID